MLVPAGLALGLLYATAGIPGPSVHALPFVAGIFAVLLGMRFNRSRVVLAALVLMLVQLGLMTVHQMEGAVPMAGLFSTAGLLACLSLVAIAMFQERGFLTLTGMARFAMLAGMVVLVWCVMYSAEENAANDAGPAKLLGLLPMGSVEGLQIAWPIWVAFCVMAAVLGYRVLRWRETIDAGLLGAGLALMLALWHTAQAYTPGADGHYMLISQSASVWLGAGTLMLLLAILEASYAMAFRDELTGLPARRALREAMLKLPAHYAIAMVDIDHFKKLNDKHGHDVGDQVLRMVAQQLARVGGGGRAFRYGGEEFTILFAGKSAEAARPHVEAIREAIADKPFAIRSKARSKNAKRGAPKRGKGSATGAGIKVTVSIGLAERSEKASSTDEVMKAADKALYRAKKGGRNQVKG